jgi:AhpC/TSA antioxidant enzyme
MDSYLVLSQAQLLRVSDGQVAGLFETGQSDGEAFQGNRPMLILIWPQLGDFDTLEYAWWLKRERSKLADKGIEVRAVGIGDRAAGQKFCEFTSFSPEYLFIDPTAQLHGQLDLYKGLSLNLPGLSAQQKGYFNLLLMCAGIGSPGTLKEVFRGYTGDKSAPQLIADEEVVKAPPLPALKGELFKAAGGKGFQRPFELATLRLRNMAEVLSHWQTYVPDAAYLTQRGATFLFAAQNTTGRELVYEGRDRNILGFAENMSNPFAFLDACFSEDV